MLGQYETEQGNCENQNDLENVTVKIEPQDEEEDEIIAQSLPHFSYTLDLSFQHKRPDEIPCEGNKKITSFVKPSLKYVKLKSDNSIETNSDTPWALAKKVFPRSLERILANCGIVTDKKIRNGKLSPFNSNSKECKKRLNTPSEKTTYSNFQKCDGIWNSTVNSGANYIERPKCNCIENELSRVEENDIQLQPFINETLSLNETSVDKQSKLNVQKENVPQNTNNILLVKAKENSNSSKHMRNKNQVVSPKKAFTSLNETDMNYEYNIEIGEDPTKGKEKTYHKKLTSITTNEQCELIHLDEDQISVDNLQSSCNVVNLDLKKIKRKKKPKISSNETISINTELTKVKEAVDSQELFPTKQKEKILYKEFGNSIEENENNKLQNRIDIVRSECNHLSDDQSYHDSIHIGANEASIENKKVKQKKKQKISAEGIDEEIHPKVSVGNTEFFKVTEQVLKKKKKKKRKDFLDIIEENDNVTRRSGEKKKNKANTDNHQNESTSTKINVIQNDCNDLHLNNVKIKQKKKRNIVAEGIDNQINQNLLDNMEFDNIMEGGELLEKHIKKKKKGENTKFQKFREYIEENEYITEENKKKRKHKENVQSISCTGQSEFLMTRDSIDFNPQIGCDDLNDKNEKIRPIERKEMNNLDLQGEYIRKKKKKDKFKEVRNNNENSISIDQSNIENENSTNVDYKKRKKKASSQSHTKIEEKVIEDDRDNTIFDHTVNHDNDLCLKGEIQVHKENSELVYTNNKNSKKKHSKQVFTEFSNFEDSLSGNRMRKNRKKGSSAVSNGDVENNGYMDMNMNDSTTEIETEHIVDVVSIKKHKKKKRHEVTSSDKSTYGSEFEKCVPYKSDTIKEADNVVTGKKQDQKCMENKGEITSNENGNRTIIKLKKQNILLDEKNINRASEENRYYTGNNQDKKERRKIKKNKNKKRDVDQSPIVHDSEEIRSENYPPQPNIIDDSDFNSNNETTEVKEDTNKCNKKKGLDLDKRISDLLTAKVELLLKASGLDQWRNDGSKPKKNSNIKIVDSTLNININTDIIPKKSQDELNSNEVECHKKRKKGGMKTNENNTALERNTSDKFSSSDDDFVVLKFGNGKMKNNKITMDMPYNSENENQKKKLKQVSSYMNTNEITYLEKEESVPIVENVLYNNTKHNNQNFKSSDIPLMDLTSDSSECIETSKAEYIEHCGPVKIEGEYYERKLNYQSKDYIDNMEADTISEKKKSNEIFIKNNSIPKTEIDLSDSDEQSEIDEFENIQNLHNIFNQEMKKIEYSVNNAKKKTKKRHLSDPLIEPCEIFHTEAFVKQSDQGEKCKRKRVSNKVHSDEKKANKRKAHRESTDRTIVKKNKQVEKTEIFEEDEDLFTGIFRKEISAEKDNKNDIQQNIPLAKEMNNVKPTFSNKCLLSEENVDSLDTKDLSNQPLENSVNQESFSFADILSPSHSARVMQKYSDIVTESNMKSNSPKVFVSDKASSKEANSSNRSATLKKLGKSEPKQRTLDSFVEKFDSEDRKKKQKVIKLLKESKSIQEIEEELEIPNVDEEREAVQHLVIETPWTISPIHKIAYFVSGNPNASQKQALKSAGITFKLGKYTKEEDEKITQNWLEFCKYHNWDTENYLPFLKTSAKSGTGVLQKYQRLKFAQFISKGFENRLMYSVYHRFQRLFSQKERENGRFTEEDDKIIEEYVRTKKSDTPFADLANILKRTRLAILKRYRLIESKKSTTCVKVIWNKELAECLLVNLLEVTCSVDLSELKHRFITTQEWEKVSKNMDIPIDKLRRAWIYSLHPRFFTPNYLQKLCSIKKQLVDLLSVKYNDWREVNWTEVAKEFDGGFTNTKLCKVMRDLLVNVPPKRRNDFHKSLEYLRKHYHVEDRKLSDRFKFVEEILEETENGTKIPKISKIFKKKVPMEKTEQTIELSDEWLSD